MNHISRVAIITGASSGIGEATARQFIAHGYGVVGNARNADKLRALEQELGPLFVAAAGDATDPVLQERWFALAQERFGQPADIVVANAGRGLGGAVTEADLSKFEEILKLNVTATLALLQKAARKMLEEVQYPQKAADIVIIGSVVGRHISPFSAVYGATKFAVHALAEGLRREVGPKGIRVSLIEPGIVVSGFQEGAGYSDDMVQHFDQKFGPLLHGEDVASAINFIVSRPPHVHISDILVRPTRQDYP
ncbi:MAG: SDR family oxidoreductase [Ferrovum sp.]|nr:SDR family oxidoreductase [Ferrovum sp.]NDU87293.1 SDR family oxidoreductase [Ferrovum sp.]